MQVYGVPGKDILFRETIGEAVKRSIKDEIGCEVKKYHVISVNVNYKYGNHYIGIGVVADIKGKVKLTKSEEWEEWEWFDKNEIPENLFPTTRNLIRCYLENKVNVAE